MGNNVIFFVAGVLIIFAIALAMVAPYLLANPHQDMINSCAEVCNQYLDSGRSLDLGPCLMDPMDDSDWVCDVVHNPRNQLDNMRENQCSAYLEGEATHFIELDTNCNFVRTF